MAPPHSDRYVEKCFLYLIACSLALHAGILAVIFFLPADKKVDRTEPVMIDLQDIPHARNVQKDEKRAPRPAEEKRRVPRETAPKGEAERDKIAAQNARVVPTVSSPPQQAKASTQSQVGKGGPPLSAALRGESFLKPKELRGVDFRKLLPSAATMATLEDRYRKKYGPELEEGETKFLNTNDILFGSFMRRFETAVYGVWRYPQEAIAKGVQGGVPVRITFNRNGEIEKVQLLESSGNKVLDEEVLRTLRILGPVGPLPKGYDKDTFNLVAFFRYSIFGGAVSGVLN